jgi:hypothetical protein
MNIVVRIVGFVIGTLLFAAIFPRANTFQAMLLGGSIGVSIASGLTQSAGGGSAPTARRNALNEALAALAKDNGTAIKIAQEVIDSSQQQAGIQQRNLAKRASPLPVGLEIAPGESIRVMQASRALNEVAHAYYIKGQALEAIGRIAYAVDAYRACAQLTHARLCEETVGWWSPAERAKARLEELGEPIEAPVSQHAEQAGVEGTVTVQRPLTRHQKVPEGKKRFKCSACGWYVIPPEAMRCQHCGTTFENVPIWEQA